VLLDLHRQFTELRLRATVPPAFDQMMRESKEDDSERDDSERDSPCASFTTGGCRA
jgi:hypothetical protein